MSIKTECGLVGILAINPIKKDNIYYSLSEIQHRGQDSYGLVISSKDKNVIIKENGLVPDSLDIKICEYPSVIIGHVRYATSKPMQINSSLQSPNSFGEKLTNSFKRFSFSSSASLTSSTSSLSLSTIFDEDPKICIQPIEICNNNKIYLSHNGNLFNIKENSLKLDINSRLRYPTDTYVFKYIWEQNFSYNNTKTEMISYIKNIICTIPGAYSCIVTFYDNKNDEFFMWGFRDRYGYKPLSIGKIDNNYCFISETIQLENSNEFINDVLPGEIYEISTKTNQTPKLVYSYNSKYVNYPFFCSMEAIYFMKKESLLFNGLITVHDFRRKLGYELAKQELTYENQQLIKKMVVTYVPESARSICIGYCEMMSVIFKDNIITKIENIRSFIESSTDSRNGKIKRKFWFNEEEIKKINEIIIIDDSIVRGNTMIYIINKLKEINPLIKIHIRIGAPYLTDECNFGIDIASRDELIYNKSGNPQSVDALRFKLNVDSLMFLDIDNLEKIMKNYNIQSCTYCFGAKDIPNIKCLEW